MEIIHDLTASLTTGFVDKQFRSKQEYQPKLIVNNKPLNRKILHTVLHELNTCTEFAFSVAFLARSGVAVLINILEELQTKGIKGRILVSQYQNFTEPEALKSLLVFGNLDLRIVTEGNFHAKGYIFRHHEYYSVIVGSSNLTASALTTNKEWNLMVSGLHQSKIIEDTLEELHVEFERATRVDRDFIERYSQIYDTHRNLYVVSARQLETISKTIVPNKMQVEALENLHNLRAGNAEKGPQNKALLISATGTGKTYLSAFDVQAFNPKRMLFVVHRANIARAALESYDKLFKGSKKSGVFFGGEKDTNSDFVFSTIQTLSRDHNLDQFAVDDFDYIVIDETHRAGAATYQKILNHFSPKFLLGMTSTPERTDGYDIFKSFDYNIAYEIRLHRALEEDMLCPFHYYGVTDVSVDDTIIEEERAFLRLTSDDRVNHIIEKSRFYGTDDGVIRGLIFCNLNTVSRELSKKFNQKGFTTVSLSGDSTELEREEAINRLETDDPNKKLDYVFTVDIFNEGIDIPRVNQIIMLRPTQSAIVFVQQLGRGLRRSDMKEYLTVIDFIGNHNNNYLIPIALYGDSSYSKDRIRKLLAGGSGTLPGSSTVNFDKISKEKIFRAIDVANMQLKQDLVKDYDLLKFKIGRVPMMMDFIEHGSRDPKLYVNYSKSHYNFVKDRENGYTGLLNTYETKILELISSDIANGKRIEEVLALRLLIENRTLKVQDLRSAVEETYGITCNDELAESVYRNLNFLFVTEAHGGKRVSAGIRHGIRVIDRTQDEWMLTAQMVECLGNQAFLDFLTDALDYARYSYELSFQTNKFFDGFILYGKYSRKDVFRILCWDENPVAQNVGGYIISRDKKNCPIFVNYHKEDDISNTTKYEDEFISNYVFQWMSKSRRTLESPDVLAIKNYRQGLRMPLFIKKHNDEGTEFYYMGDVRPIDDQYEQMTMPDDKGNQVSVVKMKFEMLHPVEPDMYEYITAARVEG